MSHDDVRVTIYDDAVPASWTGPIMHVPIHTLRKILLGELRWEIVPAAPEVDDRPVHQPESLSHLWHPARLDKVFEKRRWFASCDPDQPRVNADGICTGCGEEACPVCGREMCPDHPQPKEAA